MYTVFAFVIIMNSKLRVSLVIPAYNEEHQLALCLDAIARQTVRPFEVLVVDNNSTDQTAAIARRYPFVTLLSEARQGPVFARNAGFNAARGEIIGRIDVDSHIAPNWIERVQAIFADASVDAVSGSLGFHDAPYPRFFEAVDLFFRRYLARNLGREGELFLYGGNMAIRRQLWRDIRDDLCVGRHLHEDIDMAAHLAGTDYRVVFKESLCAEVSVRRVDSDMRTFYTYVLANPRTYAVHGLASRRYMYPVAYAVLICYLPLRALYRAYDPNTRRLSLARMFRPSNQRVSPINIS
jgi:glycosyltransferase involved in cell wall biosynthesis